MSKDDNLFPDRRPQHEGAKDVRETYRRTYEPACPNVVPAPMEQAISDLGVGNAQGERLNYVTNEQLRGKVCGHEVDPNKPYVPIGCPPPIPVPPPKGPQYLLFYPPGCSKVDTVELDENFNPVFKHYETSNANRAKEVLEALMHGCSVAIPKENGWKLYEKVNGKFELVNKD